VPSLLLILRINTLVQLVLPLQEIDFSSYYPTNHCGIYARVLHRKPFRRTIGDKMWRQKRKKLRACGVTRVREINITLIQLDTLLTRYEKFSKLLVNVSGSSAYFSASDWRKRINLQNCNLGEFCYNFGIHTPLYNLCKLCKYHPHVSRVFSPVSQRDSRENRTSRVSMW